MNKLDTKQPSKLTKFFNRSGHDKTRIWYLSAKASTLPIHPSIICDGALIDSSIESLKLILVSAVGHKAFGPALKELKLSCRPEFAADAFECATSLQRIVAFNTEHARELKKFLEPMNKSHLVIDPLKDAAKKRRAEAKAKQQTQVKKKNELPTVPTVRIRIKAKEDGAFRWLESNNWKMPFVFAPDSEKIVVETILDNEPAALSAPVELRSVFTPEKAAMVINEFYDYSDESEIVAKWGVDHSFYVELRDEFFKITKGEEPEKRRKSFLDAVIAKRPCISNAQSAPFRLCEAQAGDEVIFDYGPILINMAEHGWIDEFTFMGVDTREIPKEYVSVLDEYSDGDMRHLAIVRAQHKAFNGETVMSNLLSRRKVREIGRDLEDISDEEYRLKTFELIGYDSNFTSLKTVTFNFANGNKHVIGVYPEADFSQVSYVKEGEEFIKA